MLWQLWKTIWSIPQKVKHEIIPWHSNFAPIYIYPPKLETGIQTTSVSSCSQQHYSQ